MSDDGLLVIDPLQTVAQLRCVAQVPFDEIEALGFIFLSTAVEIRNRNGCPHKTILWPVPTNAATCPGTPYMKGRGRIKRVFLSIVPDSPVGVLHEGARQRGAGVNAGRCPPKAWR